MAVQLAIHLLSFTLITLVLTSSTNAVPKDCFEGTYTFTPPGGGGDVCELCPKGTFMHLKDHTYRNCFKCTEIEDPLLEILVTPCNRTQDSVIHCIHGYYRRLPMNPREKARCEKCTTCEYPILSCKTYEDTHCCQGENFDVIPDKNGVPVCWEKPWLCTKGQYFDRHSFSCLPCPAGTYMSLDYHSVTKCWKCPNSDENYLPKHALITQPCNGTHPAVVGCKDGYFIRHDMGHWNDDIGCSQCTRCNADQELYLGRECDQHHDTVCCSQPNMTVVDGPEGPKCLLDFTIPHQTSTKYSPSSESTKKIVCAKNQYLHVDENNSMPASCKPCPPGTFMDEINHFKTACEECTEFKGQQIPYTCPEIPNTVDGTDNGRPLSGAVIGLIISSSVLACLMVLVGLCLVYALRIRRRRKLYDYTENVTKQDETERLLDMEDTPMSTDSYSDHLIGKLRLLEKNYQQHLRFLTVKVVVSYSLNRIVNEHGMKQTQERDGHGSVKWVSKDFKEEDNQVCPCAECQRTPENAKKQWGRFIVETTAHMVLAEEDASQAQCEFVCAPEKSGENNSERGTLYGVRLKYRNPDYDVCRLTCVTHDQNVFNRLEKLVRQYQTLEKELKKICVYTDTILE